MKHYLDLKGRLICGDILTDASKETFYRFLHYDENTAYFNSVQCEKLKKVPCGKRSFAVINTGEEVTLTRSDLLKLYIY